MAGRYATALFELALESNAVDQVKSDLAAFDAMVASSPDLLRLVRSPVFSAEEQTHALVAVLERAGITVAEQLNDARMNDVRDALKQVTGKDVQVDVTVDPSIIGGLKVKLGSRMVDASLRTKLNSIKFAMKEAR